jgi:hypothetical protein
LAPELGHEFPHRPPEVAKDGTSRCQGDKEVEVESVAYVLAVTYGLDTSDYTFAYVTGWAHSSVDVEAALWRTADRVLAAARRGARKAPRGGRRRGSDGHRGPARTAERARPGDATAARVPSEPHGRLRTANAAAADFYRAQYPDSWAPEYLTIRLGSAG